IPAAGAREDPGRRQRAFAAIDAALAEGELVCIFPEGALTKDGGIATFKSGVERILGRTAAAGRPVPVVPMALRGLWASMWSRRDSRLGRMRVPRRLRARVEVVAGAPLHGEVSAEALETRVRELRGDAAGAWRRHWPCPAVAVHVFAGCCRSVRLGRLPGEAHTSMDAMPKAIGRGVRAPCNREASATPVMQAA